METIDSKHDIQDYFEKMFKYGKNASGWTRDPVTGGFELECSRSQLPQMVFIPKEGKSNTVKAVLDRVLREVNSRCIPSPADVEELYANVKTAAH